MRLSLSLCLMIKASIVIADENCLAYAPDDTWPQPHVAMAGFDWLSLSPPLLDLELGMTPVELCQQLDGFVADTEELESANPQYPAVEVEYADFVGPFIGTFAPSVLRYRGQITWFDDPDIARPTTFVRAEFSAPPSGSQLTEVQTRYVFTNGSGRLPTTSQALDPFLQYLGPYTRVQVNEQFGQDTYEWIINDGAVIRGDAISICSLEVVRRPFENFDPADTMADRCDGRVVVAIDWNQDVLGFVERVNFSIEDRARTRDTWRIDAKAAQSRSDEIAMYVNSPDGELNVRSGPSINDDVWYVLENGDRVWVGETVGNWSYIKASQGRGGWVYTSLLADRI